MLVLATDYSGVFSFYFAIAGFLSLLNALAFLLYYHIARPRGLPRPFPRMLIVSALAFTVIYPVGFLCIWFFGNRMGSSGGSVYDGLAMAGLPAIAGSLSLLPSLRRDISTGRAWLAPMFGLIPTLVLQPFAASSLGTEGPTLFSPLLLSLPWHLTCALVFFTSGRRAWNLEMRSRAACPSCGYSRAGLTGSTCPECGKALPA